MRSESLRLSKGMVGLLASHGINTPTPIQKEIIPAIFAGRDVIAQSETGSGKTLSFAIPIIESMNRRDGLRALIIAPTRELASQIAGEFIKFSDGKHLGITAVYGGVSINEQRRKLERTNIIVGTPGRLLDLLNRGMLSLDTVQTVVLDEADRMLDMGFIRDIEKILHRVPADRRTLLFSATISKEIQTLARKFLRDPLNVEMESKVKPELLHQTYYQTTPEQKQALLVHLLKSERELALVFCNRKHITKRLADRLSKEGIPARCLNGNMSQPQRERVTSDFRHQRFNVLVATDVAARGLDIDGISHVYNYEIPRDVESYTHRVGRTARAGKHGEAISLVSGGEERDFFKQILFNYQGVIRLRTTPELRLPAKAQPPAARHQQPQAQRHDASRPEGRPHQQRQQQKKKDPAQAQHQDQSRYSKNAVPSQPYEHSRHPKDGAQSQRQEHSKQPKKRKSRPWEQMHQKEKGWSNHPARKRVN
jgi:ATP-dependent RNA helicase DeaD